MIVLTAGKGGVGKSTCQALILSALLDLKSWNGRILVVDADPTQSLHLALGIPAPPVTLSQVMDEIDLTANAVQGLPMSIEQHTINTLQERGVLTRHTVKTHPVIYMAMGQGHKPGCYCQVNQVLSRVLQSLWGQFDIILIDAEAGLEHLNRKRISHVDILLLVTTPHRTALSAAERINEVIRNVGITVGETCVLLNRTSAYLPQSPLLTSHDSTLFVLPDVAQEMNELERGDLPILALPDQNELSGALADVATYIMARMT